MFVTYQFMYESGRKIQVFLLVARPNCYVVNELLYKKYILFKPNCVCSRVLLRLTHAHRSCARARIHTRDMHTKTSTQTNTQSQSHR